MLKTGCAMGGGSTSDGWICQLGSTASRRLRAKGNQLQGGKVGMYLGFALSNVGHQRGPETERLLLDDDARLKA